MFFSSDLPKQLTWKACPGGDAPVPNICNGAGTCVLSATANVQEAGSGVCKCNPGYFGPSCNMGCPNTGNEGGACFADWGRGQCEMKQGGQASCICKPGYLGEDCRFPCPGMPERGDDPKHPSMKLGPCFGRGTCYLPAPKKFKFGTEPGDHDAKCLCRANAHGEACDIMCPTFNNQVCGGHGHRRPFHPASNRGIQNNKGCLWELAAGTAIKDHALEDGAGVIGTGRLATCACDEEGGFYGTDDSCRISCPGAGWGGYGGGRNVCGGGLKWKNFMANNNGFQDAWKLNSFIKKEVQIPSRGQCHIHYKYGAADPKPNPKAGLCSCLDGWKGAHVNKHIYREHGIQVYHDTCDATAKPKIRVFTKHFYDTCIKHDVDGERKCLVYGRKWKKAEDSMVSMLFRRSELGCAMSAGTSVVQKLGTGPNCCPKGGTSIGESSAGRGLYYASGQCLAHSEKKTFTGYPERMGDSKEKLRDQYRLGQSNTHISEVAPLEKENAELEQESNVLKEQALEAGVEHEEEVDTLREQIEEMKRANQASQPGGSL